MSWNPKDQFNAVITADVGISRSQNDVILKFHSPEMLENPMVQGLFTTKSLSGIAKIVGIEIDLSDMQIYPVKNGFKITTENPDNLHELFTKFFNKEFMDDAISNIRTRFPPIRVDPSRDSKYFKEWDDKYFDNDSLKDCYFKLPTESSKYDFVTAEDFRRSFFFKMIYSNISKEWVNEYRISKLEKYIYSERSEEQRFIVSFLLSRKMFYRGTHCEYDRILDYFPEDFKTKHAQRMYRLYFDNGGKTHTGLIRNLTSTLPDESLIQEQYNKWLKNDDLRTIEEHFLLTRYLPKFNDELFKKKMASYSKDRNLFLNMQVGPLFYEFITTGEQVINKSLLERILQ